MRKYWQAVRQFDRSVQLYMLFWATIAFAYFGVEGVLVNLYLLRLGYGPDFIGQLLGAGQLVWAVFALPAGMVGARWGLRLAMAAGMFVMTAGILLMLGAGGLEPGLRPTGLYAGWIISWVGAALAAVNAPPYLMAITNEEVRPFAFSAQQTVMAVAGFSGSVAAGFLPGIIAVQAGFSMASPVPFQLALLLAPAAYLFGGAAVLRARAMPPAEKTGEGKPGSRVPMALFLFIGLVVGMQALSEGTVRAFYNIYLDASLQAPPGLIGASMGVSQLAGILISFAMPVILVRWGTSGAMTVTTFLMALFIFLLAAFPMSAAATAAYVGITTSQTVMATARGIYTQEIVPPRWRTTISAVSTIGLALGWATAAWIGGKMVLSSGYSGLFGTGAVVALFSGALLILWLRGKKAPAPEAEEKMAVDTAEIA